MHFEFMHAPNGFVECPQVHTVYGRDVFLRKPVSMHFEFMNAPKTGCQSLATLGGVASCQPEMGTNPR